MENLIDHKKTFFRKSVILIFLMVFSLNGFAQRRQQERKIVGIWKMDIRSTKQRMNPENKKMFASLDSDNRARIESKYSSRELEFNSDKKFSLSINGEQVIIGEWEFANDGKRIRIVEEMGKKQLYKIVLLSSNKLVIRPLIADGANVLFKDWHFTKK